ncbi:MAG: SDR family oxidoreductase [Actinobacteria bacterium]|nr:SDR family oxidoreductase [Actinomycetota bacterium]
MSTGESVPNNGQETVLVGSRGPRLSGQVVLVTGAGQGIGQSIALRAAEEGAHVICVDIREETARATAASIGHTSTSLQADVADEQSVAALFTEVRRMGPLDHLCNVAGVAGPQGAVVDVRPDEWDETVRVNLRGPYLMSRAAVPLLIETGGSIVNIASALGHIGWRREAAYGPTKAALIQFTKSLALDYAPRIRANSISPGAVHTPMIQAVLDETGADPDTYGAIHPLTRKLIPPRAIADACIFLLSRDATFITGADLPVDCGMLATGRTTQELTQ